MATREVRIHWIAVLALTWLALAGAVMLDSLTGLRVFGFMTICTATWAVWDARRIELRRYRPGEAAHPVIFFWMVVQLWPLFFPWYLLVRRRVLSGKLPRGPAFHEYDVLF